MITPKGNLARPCNDCPFRRVSLSGWLGPWTPEELLQSLAATPFPCHKTIQGEGESFNNPHLKGCAGAAIYLNNNCELSRCPETAEHQDELLNIPDSETKKVFQWSHEFIEHHRKYGLVSGDNRR